MSILRPSPDQRFSSPARGGGGDSIELASAAAAPFFVVSNHLVKLYLWLELLLQLKLLQHDYIEGLRATAVVA